LYGTCVFPGKCLEVRKTKGEHTSSTCRQMSGRQVPARYQQLHPSVHPTPAQSETANKFVTNLSKGRSSCRLRSPAAIDDLSNDRRNSLFLQRRPHPVLAHGISKVWDSFKF
jgi:hypothetical protein